MRFKITDFVVLVAAASTLTGVSLAVPQAANAQTQQPAMATQAATETMQASRIALRHSNYGALKAELSRSTDPTKSAILQAAIDRLQKSHGGGAANDKWSFSLVFNLSWGSAAQTPSGGIIHD